MSKRQIKFGDVRVNELSYSHVQEVLRSNWLTMGTKVRELEVGWSKLFGDYFYTTVVISGTAALQCLLMSLYEYGAAPGDEIVTSALSFISTSTAIRAAGFTPAWVDIEKETLQVDPSLVEAAITPKTRAILVPSLMGRAFNAAKLYEIAKRHRLMLFADQCEAHGCKYRGDDMEQWADACAYSGYSAHLLFGVEMGWITTKDKQLDELCKSIRSHGRPSGTLYFEHPRWGLNFKNSDLHAAVALGNLPDFRRVFEWRKANWNYLRDNLVFLRQHGWIIEEDDDYLVSPHAFSFTFANADGRIERFKKVLTDSGIEYKRNFGDIASHGAFAYMGKAGTCPNSIYCGNYGVHWSVNQFLTQEDLDHVVKVVTKFFKQGK